MFLSVPVSRTVSFTLSSSSLCLFLSSCCLRCVISCLICSGAQRRVCVGLLCSSCLSSSWCTCGILPAESATAMAVWKPCFWGSITWWETGDCALPAISWNSVSKADTHTLYVCLMLQEIVDSKGNGKLLSFTIPSLSKPSIYHEVRGGVKYKRLLIWLVLDVWDAGGISIRSMKMIYLVITYTKRRSGFIPHWYRKLESNAPHQQKARFLQNLLRFLWWFLGCSGSCNTFGRLHKCFRVVLQVSHLKMYFFL